MGEVYFFINQEKVVQFLKCDLAVRQFQSTIGSKMGGNPSQYWFILGKTFKIIRSAKSIEEISFMKEADNIIFNTTADKNIDVRLVREKFNEFFSKQNEPEYSQDDLISPEFLKSITNKNSEQIIHTKCVNDLLEVKSNLNQNKFGSHEIEILKNLYNIPNHISAFCCRTIIGIENVVKYNIDDQIGDLFEEVNDILSKLYSK